MNRKATYPLGYCLLALALVSLVPSATGQEKKADPGNAPFILGGPHLSWAIHDAALSPDGKRIVTGHFIGYRDHSHADVWDATTGKRLLNIKMEDVADCLSVAYSSDGRRIATGSNTNNLVKVWDAETGKHLLTLKGHTESVRGVAFSPDGKRIISGGWYSVRVWDVETAKEVLKLEANTKGVWRIAVKWVAGSGRDHVMRIWNTQTGKQVLTAEAKNVVGIAFSPDSKRIVSASCGVFLKSRGPAPGTDERTALNVWDVDTGKELFAVELPKKEALNCAAFSPDGKWIVTGGYEPSGDYENLSLVKIWDATTGREVATLNPKTKRPFDDRVIAVAFTPDGSRIIAACSRWAVHILPFEKLSSKP
ncbi:MAG: WD40 repeat domain-containing protein [Gemmataceae bacterium]|nr:WD40 repeat domain-containing protein [Gemmataceae bacterium]